MITSVALIGIALASALQTIIVQRNIRSLNMFSTEIERIDERELSSRIVLDDAPSELTPVVSKLNDLLGRLELAFEREKSFTSDVAHELRTPVAGLRSTIEVALSHPSISTPRTAEEYRGSLKTCHHICLDMQRLVENLLNLARCDAGRLSVRCREVSPDTLLRECWEPFSQVAYRRRVAVSWDLKNGDTVQFDKDCLKLMLRNIFENAVTYVDEGGRVKIGTTMSPELVSLSVTNSGSRISYDDSTLVFERLWRGNEAREATGRHAGLGLAICRSLSERLGADIFANSQFGGDFTVTLRLKRTHAESC